MAKDLFVSSSPHETKVAVFEDDQLVEVYYERESSVGLVGGIYKGRVKVGAEPAGPRLGELPRSAPLPEQMREGPFPQTEIPGA